MAFNARFMLPFVLLLSLHITAHAQNATSSPTAAAAANGTASTAVVIAPTNGTQPARNASSTNTTTPATAICPLDTAAIFQADFEPVKAACVIPSGPGAVGAAATAAFCNACVCSIGVTLVQSFEAAGVRINGTSIIDMAAAGNNTDALNQLLDLCNVPIAVALLDSEALSNATLTALASCNVTQATLQCAPQVEAALNATNRSGAANATTTTPTVNATSRQEQAGPIIPAAASPAAAQSPSSSAAAASSPRPAASSAGDLLASQLFAAATLLLTTAAAVAVL